MTKTSNEYKAASLRVLKNSKPSPIFGALAYIGIGFVFCFFILKLLLNGLSDVFNNAMDLYLAGEYEAYMNYIYSVDPSSLSINLTGFQNFALELLRLVFLVISFGFGIFIMNSVRCEEPAVGNLLEGFGMPLRVIILCLLMLFLIGGGFLLLIIPGLYTLSTYRFAPFILKDNPHIGAIESLRRSRLIMNGHRKALLKLYLSFLGWIILAIFCIPASVFVLPYVDSALFLFYEDIKNSVEFPPPPTDEDIRSMFK